MDEIAKLKAQCNGAPQFSIDASLPSLNINFASNCFNHKNKILAICWGLQVCSTAAGGKVKPGKNGAHIIVPNLLFL